MVDLHARLPIARLADFCRAWKIAELFVFGSAIRDDFDGDSDIDFLVSFTPDAQWSLLDHAKLELELESLVGRPVQVLTRRCVESSDNPIRRREILRTARSIYRAA